MIQPLDCWSQIFGPLTSEPAVSTAQPPQVVLPVGQVKFTFFYSQGHPWDSGLSLSEPALILSDVIASHGYTYDAYTPARLRQLGAYETVRSHEGDFASHLFFNPGLSNLGLAAWKPFVMLHATRDLKEDDIVVYIDTNIKKHTELRGFVENCPHIIQTCLGQRDFFVGRECPNHDLMATSFSNLHQITEIGLDTPFTRAFPNLIVNFVICRNTEGGRRFLTEWLALCLQERFIRPPADGLAHDGYRWFCPEQSVCNMLIARKIQEGQLEPGFPSFSCMRDGIIRSTDDDHVAHLPAMPFTGTPLSEQFGELFRRTDAWVADLLAGRVPPSAGWQVLPIAPDDWTAHEDGAWTEVDDDGRIIIGEGDEERFHLIRYRHDALNCAEVELSAVVQNVGDPDNLFYINMWGGWHVCRIGFDGHVRPGGFYAAATVECLNENTISCTIRFQNFHDSVAIGIARPGGLYRGESCPQIILTSVQVRTRGLRAI
ncbi:hypothetical protein KGY14_06190 [Ameyamaea chiangmaiensis]|uniref:Uncharacterized protein n=1 Tax=Ameyamaea chiangmaiensis TaxID=442969 RepID=A0A850PCV5_9PROT|nr:hypothetical protein [Ameyamaea chiangmaiensis]MBS4074779.1 hypothetical protein [Ameyamaea chiangmaiensis]NVN40340.1 hypothetical protein [Ameyamaea chiangmaiensis]